VNFLINNFLPKTRFGGNPPHQNTFNNISTINGCGQFISEKDRFDVRYHTEVDFIEKMRSKTKEVAQNKITTIRKFEDFIKERNKIQDFFQEGKNTYSLLQRTTKMHHYENKNKIRNTFIE